MMIMRNLLIGFIYNCLGFWYWQQLERADRDQVVPRSLGKLGPLDWMFNSYRHWSVGIVYLVDLVYRQDATGKDALYLNWSNPIQTRRRTMIARRVLAEIRRESAQENDR